MVRRCTSLHVAHSLACSLTTQRRTLYSTSLHTRYSTFRRRCPPPPLLVRRTWRFYECTQPLSSRLSLGLIRLARSACTFTTRQDYHPSRVYFLLYIDVARAAVWNTQDCLNQAAPRLETPGRVNLTPSEVWLLPHSQKQELLVSLSSHQSSPKSMG